MIETTLKVTSTLAQESAVIRLTIPKAQVAQLMGAAIGELMSTVAAQGAGPAGPLYSYHHRGDPDVFDLEVGVPVSQPISPTGRVTPGELPAVKVVQTVYSGPYEGLGDGWCEFMQAVEAGDYDLDTPFFERYVAGPESSPDPAQWRTELNRVLKS